MVTAAASPLSPVRRGRPRRPAVSRYRRAPRHAIDRHDTRTLVEVTGAPPFDDDALDRRCSPARPSCWAPGERVLADSVELRQAAQAVRPRDRLLPGDQAPARRRTDRARLRPAAGARRRAGEVPVVGGEGRGRRRGVPRRRAPGSRCTARSATPPSSTSACGSPGSARWWRLGHPGLPPRRVRSAGELLMHFARTEEQDELASIVRSLLDKRSDSAAVRAAVATPEGYDEALWQALASRSVSRRSPSPRSTTASAPRSSRPPSCSRSSATNLAPAPLLAHARAVDAACCTAGRGAKRDLLPRHRRR